MYTYYVPDSDKFKIIWKAGIDGSAMKTISSDELLLEDWTKGEDLSVDIEVDVKDIGNYYSDLITNHNLLLGLSLSWHCDGGTTLRDNILAVKITSGSSRYNLEGTIDGKLIAGTVTVQLSCIVMRSDDQKHLKKGLILASEKKRIVIEGQKSQFPISIVNFFEDPALKTYTNSFFVLSRRREFMDYDSFFFNEYELKLNSLNPATALINSSVSSDDKEKTALLNLLMYNVYEEIISDIRYMKAKGYDLLAWAEDNDTENQLVGSVMLELVNLLAADVGDGELETAYNVIINKESEVKNTLQNLVFMRS